MPSPKKGILIDSDIFTGQESDEAIKNINDYLEKNDIGKGIENFRLRDWGVSRQRFWGCPIPVIYYEDGNYRVLDKSELPVLLPYDVNLNGKGNALLNHDSWRKIICQKTNRVAFR